MTIAQTERVHKYYFKNWFNIFAKYYMCSIIKKKKEKYMNTIRNECLCKEILSMILKYWGKLLFCCLVSKSFCFSVFQQHPPFFQTILPGIYV